MQRLCRGTKMTSLLVDGSKLSVQRPRARKDGEEVELPSLEKMRDQDRYITFWMQYS